MKRDRGDVAYALVVHSPVVALSLTGEKTRALFPGKPGFPCCACAGVRRWAKAEFVTVKRHRVDLGVARSGVREERMQKEMLLFSSGAIVYSHGPRCLF